MSNFRIKHREKIEEKLLSKGFKPENNFIFALRRPTFLKSFFIGAFAKKQYVVAINSKTVVLLELDMFGNIVDKKEGEVFDRKSLDIEFKKGFIMNKLIIKEIENPKNIYKFDITKVALGFSWNRENMKNLYKEINNTEY